MTTNSAAPPLDYIHAQKGVWSWLTTTDHKRIGLLYLFSMLVFFLFAMGLGLLMRMELMTPEVDFLPQIGELSPQGVYNRVFTLHGFTMIFMFIIPSIPAVLGNFILPMQLGANDVSFPRLNLASWYCYMAGGLFALVAVGLKGPDTGWTLYVPNSATTQSDVLFPILAAFLIGWSSILTAINFITTTHRLRAPGMGWFRMPLFVWSLYATSWIAIFATPVVGITLILVLLERFAGLGIFDPTHGGDPILFQHLFWIYSHPAVYIMVLPAMGVVSDVVSCFSRKTIFGYKFIAFSSMAIAGIGSLVWAHHMFTSGMADEARIIFSFLTFFVSIPSAIKVFNWLSTMYKGSIKLEPPMLFAMGFIFLFAIGGFTGLMNGALSTDIHIHDTSFIVAHFHYTMFGGTGVMFFGALHFWWPKMFGRRYNKKVASWSFGAFFIGFNVLYVPLFIAGLLGMPRRYAFYLPEYTPYHQVSTVGSWITAGALLVMIGNLFYSLKRGAKETSDNPWGATTLEWTMPCPPPTHQFATVPIVTHGPYDFDALEESSDER